MQVLIYASLAVLASLLFRLAVFRVFGVFMTANTA